MYRTVLFFKVALKFVRNYERFRHLYSSFKFMLIFGFHMTAIFVFLVYTDVFVFPGLIFKFKVYRYIFVFMTGFVLCLLESGS